MQIKNVIIDNIHLINFSTFNICTFFFLIYPAEIAVRLIQPCVLCVVKSSISFINHIY